MEHFSLFETIGLPSEERVLIIALLIIGIPWILIRILDVYTQYSVQRDKVKFKQDNLQFQEQVRKKRRENQDKRASQLLTKETIETLIADIPPQPLTIREQEKVWLKHVVLYLEDCGNNVPQIPEPKENPV